MPRADAGDSAPAPHAAPTRARPWVLVAWCLWLLVWLAPALLLGPATPDPRPWLEPASASAAVLAGAALFLVAAWPFWPALASDAFSRGGSPEPPHDPRGKRGGAPGPPRDGRAARDGCGDPPRGTVVGWRLVGLSAMEVLVLAALAAPMLTAARAVGGRLHVWPAAATGAGLAAFGIGLRLASAGLGGGAPRRLMAGALLIAGGPPAVWYASAETIGPAIPWLPQASPVVALAQAGTAGWPGEAWSEIARLWLWPMVGVGLGVLGMLSARRSARRVS